MENNNNTYRESFCGRVAVILGYYNGEKYLAEQIRSILNQSHRKLELFIWDDCSKSKLDLEEFNLTAEEKQKLHIKTREVNIGYPKNFLNALDDIGTGMFEYFAFSDQDDIWHCDKIANALAVLTQCTDNQPTLYCARTSITDKTGQIDLGTSPLFAKPSSFANALVQNIGGGNTMVFNKTACELVVKSSINLDVCYHDWWCYQIISGAGGVVHYDPKPCLKYRQHSGNQIGANNSLPARFNRIRGLLDGRFRDWNNANLVALLKNQELLTPNNRRCLHDFVQARQSGLFLRFFLCKRAGIYRQTLLGNLALLLGLLINKV